MCCEKHCAHDERTETPERRVLHDIGFFGAAAAAASSMS